MKFGEILSKAWKTIWKHKILWLFGILAGCSANVSAGGNFRYQYSSSGNNVQDAPNFFVPDAQNSINRFFDSLSNIQPWAWVLIGLSILILILAISFISLLLGTLGTTGVIKGTLMAEDLGEEDKPLSFGKVFKGLKPYFWKVLLLTLIVNVGGVILGLILAIPILILAVCTFFLGAILLIPVSWFIATLVQFTTIAIIEENLGIIDAFKRAWSLLIKNLGNVTIMFLILGVGGVLVGLFLAVPIFLSLIPMFVHMGDIMTVGYEAIRENMTLTAILFAIALPIVIFLGGVLQSYILSAWTLTYRQIAAETEIEPEMLSLPEENIEKS